MEHVCNERGNDSDEEAGNVVEPARLSSKEALLKLIDENHKHGGSLVSLAFATCAWKTAYADELEEDTVEETPEAKDSRRREIRAMIANLRVQQDAAATAAKTEPRA